MFLRQQLYISIVLIKYLYVYAWYACSSCLLYALALISLNLSYIVLVLVLVYQLRIPALRVCYDISPYRFMQCCRHKWIQLQLIIKSSATYYRRSGIVPSSVLQSELLPVAKYVLVIQPAYSHAVICLKCIATCMLLQFNVCNLACLNIHSVLNLVYR